MAGAELDVAAKLVRATSESALLVAPASGRSSSGNVLILGLVPALSKRMAHGDPANMTKFACFLEE